MNLLKQILRNTALYKPARKIYRKLKNVPRHPLQNIATAEELNLIYLGTEYGGWAFIDDGDLNGCTIISAGLGEDASFDVEFAQRYNARIIVVDPTPRAIEHFNAIIDHVGSPSTCDYSEGGKQPIAAYDLSGVNSASLTLVEKALWNESTTLRFFEPANPEHVSHSILNYQNSYSETTSCIEVQAITLLELLADLGLEPDDIQLIKLDIEGAEIEVLTQSLAEGFRPKQVLVEFDELNVPSSKGFERVSQVHQLLESAGYQVVRTDGQADFLYVRVQTETESDDRRTGRK